MTCGFVGSVSSTLPCCCLHLAALARCRWAGLCCVTGEKSSPSQNTEPAAWRSAQGTSPASTVYRVNRAIMSDESSTPPGLGSNRPLQHRQSACSACFHWSACSTHKGGLLTCVYPSCSMRLTYCAACATACFWVPVLRHTDRPAVPRRSAVDGGCCT
jgi:hypothetical protein